ncbi:MAG: hypothetical protein WHU94_08630 [Thermogemmata sp.]
MEASESEAADRRSPACLLVRPPQVRSVAQEAAEKAGRREQETRPKAQAANAPRKE